VQAIIRLVPPDLQSEAAIQLLMRCCGQLAIQGSHDVVSLDRLKTLLRLLISNEGRHQGTTAVESASETSVVVATAAAVRRVDLRRYKTELCRSYAETGQCRYGVKCQFAHGADELRPLARHPRYRTELCHSFHVTGFCPYGSRCNFIHSDATAPSAMTESSTNSVQIPTAMPLLQHSSGNCLAVKQSNDVNQRAICGRPAPDELCHLAALQALGPSQATSHMKLTQYR